MPTGLIIGIGLAFVAVALWLAINDPAPRGGSFEAEPQGIPDPRHVYDPVKAGEELPGDYSALLARDAIAPIYEPKFVDADAARYDPDALVLGVALGDDAHAYPIELLHWREMVIDEVDGVPLLATW